ncbi:MAG: M20/M25/M40 family metallo-hydrolase, partial [Myxococcota bacterium]
MSEKNYPSAQTLTDYAVENLTRVIAIDSQSDELSDAIPSTEGQRRLSDELRRYFESLSFHCEQDENANLIVSVPARSTGNRGPIALMVHIDTAKGTLAVPELCVLPSWDGTAVPYPKNPHLQVSTETFPTTRAYQGHDVLHGPGTAPVGFDDKLGVAQLMTLARVLAESPDLETPELLLVFRPDEEIGRMSAITGLAETLAKRGVTHGYTIDGLEPFEINTENFNASQATVDVEGSTLDAPDASRKLTLNVYGCKSHGATAKAEGYLNATVIFARLIGEFDPSEMTVVDFKSDPDSEVNARVVLLLRAEDADALNTLEERAVSALGRALEPHAFKGARFEAESWKSATPARNDCHRALTFVRSLIETPGPKPLLSEDSDGYEGYSNPYAIEPTENGARIYVRLRDFTKDGLEAREAHVRAVARDFGRADIAAQYVNMGPALAARPELVAWADDALATLGIEPKHLPIRGGTGVDPFVERGISIANLGTGYFAPESEKELTSKQILAQTVRWLVELVRIIARA